ncbi:phosphonate C-P lyase system protein PhnG [Natrarchaeobius sp. A-rgal3]|uniref:phosphonate C-P lyase system protein PhnG n=1 Tax=Natrarchaeobius versutus TaxID=1679078 RepID=UPI00350E9907
MEDPRHRSDRFELIAACEGAALVELAELVLDGETTVEIRQAPKPQLVMQRVRDPVHADVFNLGEVLVTGAEVELAGERGFAMVAGRAEAPAVAGAIVDAAIEADHPEADRLASALTETRLEGEQRRKRQWAESTATAVEFESMEGEL